MQAEASSAVPKCRSAVYIRLSLAEQRRLATDAEILGKTAPEVMKDVYFGRAPTVPLLASADQQALMVALARIGNNMNQIARHLNSGGRPTFQAELTLTLRELTALRSFLTSKYCRCEKADEVNPLQKS